MFRMLAASALLAIVAASADAAVWRMIAGDPISDQIVGVSEFTETTDNCVGLVNTFNSSLDELASVFNAERSETEFVTLNANGFLVFGTHMRGPRINILYYLECLEDEAL